MAKKEETSKIVLERVYNVPLRREFLKVSNWRKTEKAVKALRQFIEKHMKSDNVALGRYANQFLWKHGLRNPPHHIKVTASKDEKGRVTVELTEMTARAKREIEKDRQLKERGEKSKKEEKKEAPKKEETKAEKIEEKVEEVNKEKGEKAKEVQKEEIKEMKKEHPKVHAPKPQQSFQKDVETHPSGPKHL